MREMDSERQWNPSTRRPRRLATVLAAVALVVAAGGAGGAIALALEGAGQPPAGTSQASPGQASSSTSIPKPASGVSSNRLDIPGIVKKVDPAVVDITSNLAGQGGVAAGTGMVLTSSGEVLTNNHVIDGASSVTARVAGQSRSYTATVVGADPTDDVALLRLNDAAGLTTVSSGDSSGVSVGEQVVAIGNALDLQGPPTVTQGIVTAVNRSITAGDPTGNSERLTGLIQTDAPLSPGNSGGPLVDSAGQVIGMNTAADVVAPQEAGSSVGFAIPINRADAIAQQIQAHKAGGNIVIGPRPLLGVEVTSVGTQGRLGGPGYGFGGGGFGGGGFGGGIFGGTPGSGGSTAPVSSGALVIGVEPGSPAQSGGLRAGDVIVSLGGKSVDSPSTLTKLMDSHHPGDQVSVGWVDPSGGHHSATVHLVTGPAA